MTWVEVTCATEGQDESLAHHANWRCSFSYVPHDRILIRWTNSVRAKIKQANRCRDAGVVSPGDSYVIAINGGALAVGNYGFGSSQLPYVVEATMAVGSRQFVCDRETLILERVEHQVRTHLLKDNGAYIPAAVFYDVENAGISAVVGCGSFWSEGAMLPLLVAHNPHATCSVPFGDLGRETDEWAATLDGWDTEASYWGIAQVLGYKSH